MPPEATTTRRLVVFTLRSEEYALAMRHVHEIIRYTEPRGVGADTGGVRGVISLRDKIIPVYDLAPRGGLATAQTTEGGKIVIVESAAGVVVVDVEEVLTVDEAQLAAVPAAGSASIEAIAKVDDRLVVLLDPEGIFAAAEAGAVA